MDECDGESWNLNYLFYMECHEEIIKNMIWHYQQANNFKLLESIIKAINDIDNANGNMDNETALHYSQNACFHFDGEKFDSSNEEMTRRLDIKSRLILIR